MSRMSEMSASRGGAVAGLFVSRPVLAIVLNLLIIVAGVAAYTAVEVRELPNIDQPVITVRTNYTGATPESVAGSNERRRIVATSYVASHVATGCRAMPSSGPSCMRSRCISIQNICRTPSDTAPPAGQK